MNVSPKKDIFDVIQPDDDIFQEIEQEENSIERIKEELLSTLEKFDAKERKKEKRELTEELKSFIEEKIAKIKPKQNVIEKTVQTRVIEPRYLEPRVIEAPPQIIRETRVEVQKEKTKEDPRIDLLQKQIDELTKELKETRRIADQPIFVPGGPGVIGIPPPEPAPEGYVLTVNSNHKAEWKVATGGGSSDPTYIGDSSTEGSWRLTVSGSDLLVQRLESGVWVEKGSFLA